MRQRRIVRLGGTTAMSAGALTALLVTAVPADATDAMPAAPGTGGPRQPGEEGQAGGRILGRHTPDPQRGGHDRHHHGGRPDRRDGPEERPEHTGDHGPAGTERPDARPPAADLPVNEPSVTEPPVSGPSVTEPPVSGPSVIVPPVSGPSITVGPIAGPRPPGTERPPAEAPPAPGRTAPPAPAETAPFGSRTVPVSIGLIPYAPGAGTFLATVSPLDPADTQAVPHARLITPLAAGAYRHGTVMLWAVTAAAVAGSAGVLNLRITARVRASRSAAGAP